MEPGSGFSESRRKYLDKLLEKTRLAPELIRAVRDYCDISYRAGYFRGQKVKRSQNKSRPLLLVSAPRWINFSIQADSDFECPVCGVTVLANQLHSHEESR